MNPWKQGRLQIYASRITDCGSSMGAQQQMAEDQSGKRDKPKLTRKELDRIEAEMIMRPFVRREYERLLFAADDRAVAAHAARFGR